MDVKVVTKIFGILEFCIALIAPNRVQITADINV